MKENSNQAIWQQNVKHLPNDVLLSRLQRLAQSERKIMYLVLLHIQEVDLRKLNLTKDCTSLYQYLTQICGYSENAAYDRIQAARLLNLHPQIAQKLEDGSLKLSQLVKVSSFLKQEKKEGKGISAQITNKILDQIQNKTSFETERILAQKFDLTPQYQERIKPQQDDSVQVQITMTKEQYEVFQRALNLISHSVPDQKLADGITYLSKTYIQRVTGKFEKKSVSKQMPQSFLEKPFTHNSRKYISVYLKRGLFQKANYYCEYVYPKTKHRCNSMCQLQIDHRTPLALGGNNNPHNLRVLCGIHNRSEAKRILGNISR